MKLVSRETVAKMAIICTVLLILMKLVTSIITGCISIRADAIHSTLDMAGAVAALIGIKLSSSPADKQHPFGHGKVEDVSSTVVAGFILGAGSFIAYGAIQRLASGVTLEMVALGIYETVLAIAMNLLMAWYMLFVSRKTDSLVLRAQASHMFGDVLSSVAVLVGLILVQLTGQGIFDPLVALLVALIIWKVGYDVLRRSFGGLIDVRLPEFEERIIARCIQGHSDKVVDFHDLRTRRAGSQRYADLHLVMSKNTSVEEADEMCDHLEQDIVSQLPHTKVAIHVEPCTADCDDCAVPCPLKKKDD